MTGMEQAIEHAADVLNVAYTNYLICGVPGTYGEHMARALAEAGYLTAAITRDDIDRALINVTSNAMNYPTPSQMLGKDSGPLRKKCVDAVCELFGIED